MSFMQQHIYRFFIITKNEKNVVALLSTFKTIKTPFCTGLLLSTNEMNILVRFCAYLMKFSYVILCILSFYYEAPFYYEQYNTCLETCVKIKVESEDIETPKIICYFRCMWKKVIKFYNEYKVFCTCRFVKFILDKKLTRGHSLIGADYNSHLDWQPVVPILLENTTHLLQSDFILDTIIWNVVSLILIFNIYALINEVNDKYHKPFSKSWFSINYIEV